jgi:hypothetical protein
MMLPLKVSRSTIAQQSLNTGACPATRRRLADRLHAAVSATASVA